MTTLLLSLKTNKITSSFTDTDRRLLSRHTIYDRRSYENLGQRVAGAQEVEQVVRQTQTDTLFVEETESETP